MSKEVVTARMEAEGKITSRVSRILLPHGSDQVNTEYYMFGSIRVNLDNAFVLAFVALPGC